MGLWRVPGSVKMAAQQIFLEGTNGAMVQEFNFYIIVDPIKYPRATQGRGLGCYQEKGRS